MIISDINYFIKQTNKTKQTVTCAGTIVRTNEALICFVVWKSCPGEYTAVKWGPPETRRL